MGFGLDEEGRTKDDGRKLSLHSGRRGKALFPFTECLALKLFIIVVSATNSPNQASRSNYHVVLNCCATLYCNGRLVVVRPQSTGLFRDKVDKRKEGRVLFSSLSSPGHQASKGKEEGAVDQRQLVENREEEKEDPCRHGHCHWG